MAETWQTEIISGKRKARSPSVDESEPERKIPQRFLVRFIINSEISSARTTYIPTGRCAKLVDLVTYLTTELLPLASDPKMLAELQLSPRLLNLCQETAIGKLRTSRFAVIHSKNTMGYHHWYDRNVNNSKGKHETLNLEVHLVTDDPERAATIEAEMKVAGGGGEFVRHLRKEYRPAMACTKGPMAGEESWDTVDTKDITPDVVRGILEAKQEFRAIGTSRYMPKRKQAPAQGKGKKKKTRRGKKRRKNMAGKAAANDDNDDDEDDEADEIGDGNEAGEEMRLVYRLKPTGDDDDDEVEDDTDEDMEDVDDEDEGAVVDDDDAEMAEV